MGARKEDKSHNFHSGTGSNEEALGQESPEQNESSEDQKPTRRHHQESRNFHLSTSLSLPV
jgi:hypothetical protein